ncbi:single-stranded DNA-binding protein, partial [Candidatus Microgenomates bacterium]|nr:single-stranded DNA-binding protein [Candidatus Microgenomates bacterium]
MARSFNQVILIGNMARDPEVRTIPSGQSVASFAVATNRVWQDANGEQQEAADFHNIVAWGKLADLAGQYLSKGRKVMIVGRLQTRSWDGEDGKKNYRTEIVANEINFLDRAGDAPAADLGGNEAPAPAGKSKAKGKD